MLSQLGQVTVGQVDSIMVGQLGAIPLAAATLANSIFIVVMVFGIGLSYAISPLIASADGENNAKKITDVMQHSVIAISLMAVVLYGIVTLLALNLNQFGQDEAVASGAVTFMHLLNASLFPMLLFFAFRQFAEGLSDTKTAMYITLAANVINVVLNYIFIYGHLGFPAMGLDGAGLATFISRIL